MPEPRAVAIAVAVFRQLTRVMPTDYRRRHRDEAVQLLRRLASESHLRRGLLGVLVVTASAVGDLFARLPMEYVVRIDLRRHLDGMTRDVRYAWRSVRRRPLSSATAIATLAVGIGLNAAVFAVVDWVMLRPLPYPSPHELVRVFTAGAAPVTGPADVTYSEFPMFSRAEVLRTSFAFSTATRVMSGQGLEPAHVVLARVAGDLAGTLAIYPEVGRAMDRQETAAGAPVVIVSHGLWRNRFGGDRAIVGRPITIDGRLHTVIGVMPEGRGYPHDADIWRPLTRDEQEDDDRENVMIARLVSGASVERASVELATLAGAASHSTRRAWAEDIHRTEVRDVRTALTAVFASSALVLLMACANVAALIAARGVDRAGEIALRGALGATRARLLRELLTESLMLAAAGGAAGWLLARWTLDLLLGLAPATIPRLGEIAVDGRVVTIGIAATCAVGVAVGVAPARRASRLDVRETLRHVASARSSRRTQGRRLLVALQTAMAVVLTIGAGLLARSLQYLTTMDHGFAADRVIAVDLYLRNGIGGDVRQLFHHLIDDAEQLSGVRSASVALRLPTEIAGFRVSVRRESGPADARASATLRPIMPRYFETAGIRLAEGRVFAPTDKQNVPGVAIVNAAFVRDVLRGERAIGLHVLTDVADAALSIVGVVADVSPAGESDRAAVYVPIDQVPIAGGSLLVRTVGEPRQVVPALTTRLRMVAPALARDRIHVLADDLQAGRALARFNTQLVSAFAGLALLLSAIGIYGLTAGEVAARWRELAVRLALGARHRDALWRAMRPGASSIVVGVIVGLGIALAAGRSMSALLHGIEPWDPVTLVSVPAILMGVGLLAMALAAARVLRADPAVTLRNE